MIEYYLPAASSYASDIDNMIWLILILVGFWFVLCQAIFFYFIFRYRKKEGVPAQYITGEEPDQKRWITIPHFLVLICDAVILVPAIMLWYNIKQDLPDADVTVRIISQQWAWTFIHPGPDGDIRTEDDNITTVNELHVQKDTLYHYKLESMDVIHDFSVPVFRLKQDAIPGRVITGWFEPTMIGEWDIQCAEICGIGHGIMGARIFVESSDQHAAWIAENSTLSYAANSAPRSAEN